MSPTTSPLSDRLDDDPTELERRLRATLDAVAALPPDVDGAPVVRALTGPRRSRSTRRTAIVAAAAAATVVLIGAGAVAVRDPGAEEVVAGAPEASGPAAPVEPPVATTAPLVGLAPGAAAGLLATSAVRQEVQPGPTAGGVTVRQPYLWGTVPADEGGQAHRTYLAPLGPGPWDVSVLGLTAPGDLSTSGSITVLAGLPFEPGRLRLGDPQPALPQTIQDPAAAWSAGAALTGPVVAGDANTLTFVEIGAPTCLHAPTTLDGVPLPAAAPLCISHVLGGNQELTVLITLQTLRPGLTALDLARGLHPLDDAGWVAATSWLPAPAAPPPVPGLSPATMAERPFVLSPAGTPPATTP